MAKKQAAKAAAGSSKPAGTPLEKVQEVLASARPLAAVAVQQYQQQSPKVLALYAAHEDKVPLLVAVSMLLFGLHFSLCIITFRAFQLLAQGPIQAAYNELDTSYKQAMQAVRKDADAGLFSGDACVAEVAGGLVSAVVAEGAEEPKRLQALQAMLKCVDPTLAVRVLVCLWTGLTAVLATMWSGPLRALVVGAQFQDFVTTLAAAKLPSLEADFPDHGRWIQCGLKAFGFFVGFVFAYLLSSISFAASCALDGSRVVSKALVSVAEKKGWMDEQKVKEQGPLVVYGVAGLGLFSQLLVFDAVPWYLSPVFLPGLFAESILGWFL